VGYKSMLGRGSKAYWRSTFNAWSSPANSLIPRFVTRERFVWHQSCGH